ncbi:uncharacterized protein ACJ7VT_007050 [Polymixia lowei]
MGIGHFNIELMLPYEEHINAGGAELKVPECPIAPRTRGIRGRKPMQRGRKPGLKSKERKTVAPPPHLPPAVFNPDGTVVVKRGRGRPPGRRNKATLIAQAKVLAQQQAKAKAAASHSLSPLPPATASPAQGNQHQVHQTLQTPSTQPQPVHPAIHPTNMPLTPDLSPMSAPFLPFQPKLGKELKQETGDTLTQPLSPGALLSALPRHHAGGSLGGFSPTKGMCPLDVFRTRLGLQRGVESPALTPQDPALHPSQHQSVTRPLQPKIGSPDTLVLDGDQPQHQHQCSGCSVEEDAQRGGSKEGRNRPPLPPLRVLPLDLDCSVQVRQLMRTRLGTAQLQTFTRRLSEVLSQDLSAKPPCSPITPPPEQALPLNLSKRSAAKRPRSDDPEPRESSMNGDGTEPSKKPRMDSPEQAEAEDLSLGGRSSSERGSGVAGGPGVEMETQEKPADLSSPSRIRAFLLGLPPFQVKLEEDLNEACWGKPLPPPLPTNPQRTGTERAEEGGNVKAEVKDEEEMCGVNDRSEVKPSPSGEEEDSVTVGSKVVKVELIKAEDVEMEMEREDGKEEAENSLTNSEDQNGDFGGQQMPAEVEASAKALPCPVLPQTTALALVQQS